jgi:hypothetical protein
MVQQKTHKHAKPRHSDVHRQDIELRNPMPDLSFRPEKLVLVTRKRRGFSTSEIIPEERDDEDLRFDHIFEGPLLDFGSRDQSSSSHRGKSQQRGWNSRQHDGGVCFPVSARRHKEQTGKSPERW